MTKKRNSKDGNKSQEPQPKKAKEQHLPNAVQAVSDNQEIPAKPLLLPRDARVLLLDIEGTTTSISFVKDTLFPYVTQNVADYLSQVIAKTNDCHQSLAQLQKLLQGFEEDLKAHGLENEYTEKQAQLVKKTEKNGEPTEHQRLMVSITSLVQFLVEKDVKGKHLKDFQGDMWKCGYEQGKLYGHVYDDVLPTFQWMAQKGVQIYIYSSGSVQAQKLLFEHSTSGNLINFLSGHFDINNAGPKRDFQSYQNILDSLKKGVKNIDATQIVFVSDVEQEVEAAREAKMQAVLSIRPGNAPCSEDALKRFQQVHSLLQLCGSGE
jgi:2,3-diketo-5-methylthio-1-phosphopentane phosphatase